MRLIFKTLICFFLFCQTVLAQSPGRVKYMESEAVGLGQSFISLPVGRKGVIMCNVTGENQNNHMLWKFVRYDTGFNTIWERSHYINVWFSYKRHYIKDNVVYLLFGHYYGQEYINFYNFDKFTRFVESLSKKSAEAINRNNSKKEEQAKEPHYNYQLLIHDLLVRNDEYIVIAEAYYPEFRTETSIGTGPNGKVLTGSQEVFAGFRYTHAIVAAFSKDGKLLWDHSFEIWNVLSYSLKERVKVFVSGEEIIMLYASSNSIATKIIRGNEVVEGKQAGTTASFDENGILKRMEAEDISYWYDDYFLVTGYQKIKNDSKEERQRKVLSFDKIKFR